MEEDEIKSEKEDGNDTEEKDANNKGEVGVLVTEEEEEIHHMEYVKCPYWLELIIVYGVFFLIMYVGNTFQNVKIVT